MNQSRGTISDGSGDCGGCVSQRGGMDGWGGVSQRCGGSNHRGLDRHLVCVGIGCSQGGGSQSGGGSRSTQVASRDCGEEERQQNLWKGSSVAETVLAERLLYWVLVSWVVTPSSLVDGH